jgi:cobalt-zinc-cadmium efflux system membrane fusion protein
MMPLRVTLALMMLSAAPAMSSALAESAKPAPPQDPPGLVRMSAEQQKTIGLQTAHVTAREITEPMRVPGTVAFAQGHVAVLRALGQARVLRLLAQPGSTVGAGQPLAEVYMPSLVDAEANLVSARASVREAASGVAVASDALRRGQMLARDGSLSRAEAERRRLELAQAEAASDSARARASALQAQIRRLGAGNTPGVATLSSPLGGVVVTVGITPGELVDTGGDAVTVADLSVVLVLAHVPEAGVPLLAIGDPARVSTPGGTRQWDGHVVALGAALDTQARTLPARIEIANPDGALRAGMAVEVVLTSDRNRRDLVVPEEAVQLVGDKHVAFTKAGDGRFQSHELQVGVQRQDWIEVKSGLAEGDEVVTSGSFALKAILQKSMLGGAG